MAWILHAVPKVGPFKSLAFRAPTPEVEKMFMASFNATVDSYRTLLLGVAWDHLTILNENFDLGTPTLAGQYVGADLAYDKLLGKLAGRKFLGTSAELRDNILDYYKDRKPSFLRPRRKAAPGGQGWWNSVRSSSNFGRRR